jgi:hypothetical protein
MRISRRIAPALCAAVLLLVLHEAGHGSVVGPNIPKGKFELGLHYRGINRQISSGSYLHEIEGNDGSLYLKYGLTNTATLTGEALVLPNISYGFNDDVDGDWRYYVMGAGLQMTMWERDQWTVEPGFYATQTLWFASQNDQCDEKWLTLDWVLIGTYAIRRDKIDIVVWGGPGYFYYNVTVLASAACSRRVWDSNNNWGGTAGLNVLFYDHVQGFFSFVYTDDFEPRFGLTYRF